MVSQVYYYPNLRQKSGGGHGVSTESGSDRVKADSNNRDCQDYYPVATALGTDLILKFGHYSGLAQSRCGWNIQQPTLPRVAAQPWAEGRNRFVVEAYRSRFEIHHRY